MAHPILFRILAVILILVAFLAERITHFLGVFTDVHPLHVNKCIYDINNIPGPED